VTLSAADIRRRILGKEKLYPKAGGGLTTRMPNEDGAKTTLMRYVEEKFGRHVEDMVWEGTLDEVSEKLDVDRVTVLRWRRKFTQLRMTG